MFVVDVAEWPASAFLFLTTSTPVDEEMADWLGAEERLSYDLLN